jgi:hypothetical protein
MTPEIAKMLVLSTAHLNPYVSQRVLPGVGYPAFQKDNFGWFIYVMDDLPTEMPNSLKVVLNYASDLSCDWVMFDQDAPTLPSLPEYEW